MGSAGEALLLGNECDQIVTGSVLITTAASGLRIANIGFLNLYKTK
jgi:hypothetical protein